MVSERTFVYIPVSYTHLDVYKRQDLSALRYYSRYCEEVYHATEVSLQWACGIIQTAGYNGSLAPW